MKHFRDLVTKPLLRGSFSILWYLEETIEGYIARHKEKSKRSIWTAKGNEIIEKAIRASRRLIAKQTGALQWDFFGP